MNMRRPTNSLILLCVACLTTLLISAQTADQVAQLDRGATAPSFTVRSLDGEHVALAMMRGKVVVLNFWFIACPPCREEMPKLNRLLDRFAGQNVVFIGFSLDSSAELKEFLAKNEFKYTIVPNSTRVAQKYGIRGAPTHVVIDKDGKVHWIGYGALDDPETELGKIIKDALS